MNDNDNNNIMIMIYDNNDNVKYEALKLHRCINLDLCRGTDTWAFAASICKKDTELTHS